MRVCSKNHAHRRLGPVRCEVPGCNALVVEIDDPSGVSTGAPISSVEPIDNKKDAVVAAREDRFEVPSEPEVKSEALAPEPPPSDLTVEMESDEDEAQVEAASQSPASFEPDVAGAFEAKEPSSQSKQQSQQIDLAEQQPQPVIIPALLKKPEIERADDLHVDGKAEAHFAAQEIVKSQDIIKNTFVTPHPAPETTSQLKKEQVSLEPGLPASSDQPTSPVVGATNLKDNEGAPKPPLNPSPNGGPPIRPAIPSQIWQMLRRPAFSAAAMCIMMLAASIGFYEHQKGQRRQEPVNPADLAWSRIANSHDPGDFREYIVKYPESSHIDLANQTAARLEEELRLADRNRVEQLAAARQASNSAQPPTVVSPPSHVEPSREQSPQPTSPNPPSSAPINSPSGGNVGAGSATPSEIAKEVVEALKAQGTIARGYIGVQIQPVPPEIAESLGLKSTGGALVAVAQPDAPAAKAGIISGDVITSVNGEMVERPRDLAVKIAAIGPNVLVELGYIHDGVAKSTTVKLGRVLNEKKVEALAPSEKSAATALASLGLSLSPASAVAAGGKIGVIVTQIDLDGPAAKKGLRSGDVILEAGGKPVTDPEDVVAALMEARKDGSRPLLLRIRSGDILHFLTLPSDES